MPGGGRDGDLGGMDGVVVGKLNLDEPVSRVVCCFFFTEGGRERISLCLGGQDWLEFASREDGDSMSLLLIPPPFPMYSTNLFYKLLTIVWKASL